jgi:hypothetical protein
MQMNMPPGFMMGPGGGGFYLHIPVHGRALPDHLQETPLCILVCNNSNSNNLQGIHPAKQQQRLTLPILNDLRLSNNQTPNQDEKLILTKPCLWAMMILSKRNTRRQWW